MDTRPTDPLTDSSLEHEIEGVLAVDPSPEFLARVRGRIASEPAPHAWGSPWRLAGAGGIIVAVAVIGVALMWQGREPAVVTSERSRVSSTIVEQNPGSTGVVEVKPEPPVSVPGTRSMRDRNARAQVAQRAAPVAQRAEPEVLISAEESAALRQLFADINQRRVEASLLLDAIRESTPLMPIREIAIEPIAVNALAPIGSV